MINTSIIVYDDDDDDSNNYFGLKYILIIKTYSLNVT